MKSAIYTRVSTDTQETEGTSLQTQLEGCLRYCQDKGYDVSQRFSETYSGLSLERPELDKLRGLVRAGDIDVVVVHCLDRLSRDPVHGVIIIEELEKHHVSLEAVTETVDSSEVGKLISYIRGFASKLEAQKIRERTMRGKRARALSGKLPSGTGRKLYGYDYIRGKGVGEGVRYPIEEETKWVKEIYRLLVDERLSINGITKRLRLLEVPTPAGGQFWYRQSVYRILTNPCYIGRTYAFTKEYIEPKTRRSPDSKRKKTGVIVRPKEEWLEIPNATPPIISEQLFDSAQLILKRNKALSSRNAKREYLLSGYIVCQPCGRRYIGYVKKWNETGKRYEQRYYRCGASQSIASPQRCDNKQLHAPTIESVVWEQVEALLTRPELVLNELQDRQNEAGNVERLEKQLTTIESRIRHKENEIDRIHKAFYLTGDEDRFKQDWKALTSDIETLKAESVEAKGRIDACQTIALNTDMVKEACDLIKHNLKTLTYAEKRFALEALKIRVMVDGKDVNIQGIIAMNIESSAIRLPRQRWLPPPL